MPPTVTLFSRPLLLAAIAGLLWQCSGDEPTQPVTTPTQATAETPQEAPQAAPELGSFGIDLSQQEPGVHPGDDFFRYANGRWLEEFELPADRSN